MTISRNGPDVLAQTEIILQIVSKNSIQARIKYKAYYDKKHF